MNSENIMRQPALALLFVCLAFQSALAAPPQWEKDIEHFEAMDKANPPQKGGILFIGSSSIRKWDTERWFPNMHVLNRGFGGSEIEDSIYYADRIVLPYEPRIVVFYAGDNDIGHGKTPERVFDDYKKFAAIVHDKLPNARLVYFGVKASVKRWGLIDKIRQVNAMIETQTRTDDREMFIDTDLCMLGTDGKPRPELFVSDGLHMSDLGYEMWTAKVMPLLSPGQQELWVTTNDGKTHGFVVGTWKPISGDAPASLAAAPQVAASLDGKYDFLLDGSKIKVVNSISHADLASVDLPAKPRHLQVVFVEH
ncbi:MAG: hypothetical protein GC162_18025 [Planctomycetes bacterium]|nr:hypothetical protein [Planctomycetota bacterium]